MIKLHLKEKINYPITLKIFIIISNLFLFQLIVNFYKIAPLFYIVLFFFMGLIFSVIELFIIQRISKKSKNLNHILKNVSLIHLCFFVLILKPIFDFLYAFENTDSVTGIIFLFSLLISLFLLNKTKLKNFILPEYFTFDKKNQNIYLFSYIFLSLIFITIVIKCAWINDDAFINFRSIKNLIAGYGPVWNITERVQAYTSTLWFYVCASIIFVTREYYFTIVFFSIILTFFAFVLCTIKGSENILLCFLAATILITSKAFIDYSTSGLENPMIYLLIVLFYLYYLKIQINSLSLFFLTLFSAFLALSRIDIFIFVFPIIIHSYYAYCREQGFQKAAIKAGYIFFLGFLPFILWEIFSLVYYGFPFPNTAYAKLGGKIPKLELIKQGIIYLFNSISWDPITIIIIFSSIIFSFYIKNNIKVKLIGSGIALYMLYVIWIGGDFMSGRFFSVPLFASVFLLLNSKLVFPKEIYYVTVIGIILIISFLLPYSPLKSDENYSHIYTQDQYYHGIADERGHWYRGSGLLKMGRNRELPLESHVNRQDKVFIKGGIGYSGFNIDFDQHIIDPNGLSDAFIARLPLSDRYNWRIGHFSREIPAGYFQTIYNQKNLIRNKSLAQFYDKLCILIKDDIFSFNRFLEIIKFNLGLYNKLIKFDFDIQVTLSELSSVKPDGTDWDAEGNICFSQSESVEVDLEKFYYAKEIELSMDHNDEYSISFYNKNEFIGSINIMPNVIDSGGLSRREAEIPKRISSRGFNKLVIRGDLYDTKYSIGHIRLID